MHLAALIDLERELVLTQNELNVLRNNTANLEHKVNVLAHEKEVAGTLY